MTQSSNSPSELPSPPAADDQPTRRVELAISILLRVGVVTSLILIVIGTIVSFVRHPEFAKSPQALPSLVQPAVEPMRSLGDLAARLHEFRGQPIVTLGLLVLIATPIMRVAVSIVAFLLEGDRPYTFITLAVFCLLMLSLVLGAVE
jgi:uncharacterized membrane protein